jgi:hypothetical protein
MVYLKSIYLVLILVFFTPTAFASKQNKSLTEKRCEYFLKTESRKLTVLITAGGTKEPLDHVRFISNFSSGAFGRGFALAAVEAGHEVVLLAPKEITKLAGPLPKEVELRPFVSTADLQKKLEEASKEKFWDVVIHSAAVSDYTPAQVSDGKISSDKDELIIRLVKTPKLIRNMRAQFGKSFLVGFKLLSGVAPEERFKIAMKQIGECRTNLCIENDLTEVSSKSHKARIVTPEGGAIPAPQGNKLEVSKALWNFIEKRQNVHWYQTVQDVSLLSWNVLQPLHPEVGKLLEFAQSAGLLPNNSGNVSVRLNDLFAITPRGVDKSKLKTKDFLAVKVNTVERKIFVNSSIKPSIDSSVSGTLYDNFSDLKAILHSHSPWFLGATESNFPFPCGVKEEGDEVVCAVRSQVRQSNEPFLVRLIDHGYMLGLTDQLSISKLEAQWKEALQDQTEHWNEVSVDDSDLDGGKTVAILSREGVIGTIRIHADQSISPRLLPRYQGKGYGRELISRIKELGLTIKTVNECKVLDYYKEQGFKVVREEGRQIYLSASL